MKKSYSMSAILVFVLLFCSPAFAGPKVAIVKSDIGKLAIDDYKFEMAAILPYDFSKPIDTVLKNEVKWGPESQAAIEKMVREAIQLAGDWPVTPGKTVFVKPNLVYGPRTMQAAGRLKSEQLLSAMTDPRVVRAVSLVALESGASKVIFGDLPAGGDPYATGKAWGLEKVAEELNAKYPGKVEHVDLKAGPYKFYKPKKTGGLALKEYAIPEIYMNTDIIISVPKMKTHSMAGVTLTMKNIGIGAPTNTVYGQSKFGLPHQRLSEVITDVCDIVGIHYSVIDAIVAMEGNGPMMGPAVLLGVIIAGKDPVAVDWVGAECMGFNGDTFGTIRLGQKYGLGTYKDVEVVGTPIKQAMQQFEPVPRANRFPGVYSHNVGWGPDAVGK